MNNSTTIKYQPLSQIAPSDDDEDEGFDDNILYDSRLVIGPNMDHRNVFELERLGQPRVRSPVIIQSLGRGRRICVLIAVLLVILLGVVVAVLFPILNHMYNHGIVTDVHSVKTSQDWTKVFNRTWTETSLRLVDIDGDGLDDVLIGLAQQSGIESESSNSEHREGHHYDSHVVAFRGYDGEEIWRSSTRSLVLYQNCMDIDVNGDGTVDCVITGHDSTCQAVDVQTGNTLWVIDPDSPKWSSHFVPRWSVYGVIVLSDVDSDGVPDLLVSHGKDRDQQTLEPGQGPSRLILLAGKTGEVIGSVKLPKGEGILMPPVKYVTNEKATYILLASGGGSSAGKLRAVSQPDLYYWITGKILANVDLSAYTWLEGLEKDKNGLASLFKSQSTDVIFTPVLLDIDTDDHVDLLVFSRGGSLALLDGKSLKEIWSKNFDGMQISSTPAPGKFNTDSVMDFMVELNSYNISQTLVISGKDGSTLWSVRTDNYTLSPGLSLKTATDEFSVFVVRMVGVAARTCCLQSLLDSPLQGQQAGESDGEQLSGSEEFQHFCTDMMQKVASRFVTCDHDLEPLMEEVMVLDQKIDERPLKLLEQKAYRFNYKVQHKPDEPHCHNVSEEQKDKIELCTVLVPTGYAGAIGDVDADGFLDYIHMTQMLGLNRSDTLNVTGPVASVVLSKRSINSAVTRGEFLHISPDAVGRQRNASPQQHVQSWKFLPSADQPWREYQYFSGINQSLFHHYMKT